MLQPVYWVGSAKEDLKAFPRPVVREIGRALTFAQLGGKHPAAKPLKGFTGASVLEIVENFDGDTYRAVYTVKFSRAVYVLRAFQKKAKRGISTPRKEMELIKARLRQAQSHHGQNFGER